MLYAGEFAAAVYNRVDASDGSSFRGYLVEICHDGLFVGNRDVQSAKLGQTLQQSGQLPDRGQFVEGVFAIAQSLPENFSVK